MDLNFHQVVKHFGKTKALSGLTLNLAGNKIIGILGRNGAGKSTALQLAAGLLKPSAGNVSVLGEKPFNSLRISANTLLVHEGMTFPPALRLGTILDELERTYPSFDRKLARNLLDHFGIPSDAFHIQLSRGMKNTFNMVAGIASRTPLSMFDEPLNGMDAGVRSDLIQVLLKEYISHPRMILLSGHQLEGVEDLFEEIVILHEGRLLHHENADEFKERFVRISGPCSVVRRAASTEKVLDLHDTLPGMSEAIIMMKPGTALIMSEGNGLKSTSVSLGDAYVALTRKKGGIDRVYTDAADGK
ncbi:ATP-binding cassette domain-containing protein [Bhargavaea beijingensis]|uniref:ABC transporter ATP-binding protein n=1 Tax=Bhargavaea beijingensis TaxID=426756 RepID=A0ABX9ZFM4_9BACL|nr:ABC transporter ATP-binding protein [Bhargavaea beijingensis]RSK35770.1 ABC transporter ATP-binding protein [Bhargavaea beijingensis]